MDNGQTAEHLRKYVTEQHGTFSWPTDACGYDQHMKFVKHRNNNWKGGTDEEWTKFVLDYADSLAPLPTNYPVRRIWK